MMPARDSLTRNQVRRLSAVAVGRSAARLAFSFESPERIEEGVSLLASLLR